MVDGHRVMGIEAGACNAGLVITHERMAMPVPESVADAEMAGIPEVFITAWDALVAQNGLTSGSPGSCPCGSEWGWHGRNSIAKSIGAKIAVTCSAGKADACRDLGADLVLERSPADWLAALQTAVPQGMNVVLDVIGGEESDRNLEHSPPRVLSCRLA